MKKAVIQSLKARKILDSRGKWTIEVKLITDHQLPVTSSVPQGKSTGSYETQYAPPDVAVRNIEKIIAPRLRGKDPTKQKEVDDLLIKLDGTPNKKRLGANATLGASLACARAGALSKNIPLWKHIRHLSGLKISQKQKEAKPRLYINVINGGLHAGNNLDIQEYLVIPKTKNIAEAVEVGTAFYHALGEYLARIKGNTAQNVGDEGGYAPRFKDNIEPFRILKKVAHELHMANKIEYGIDAAASNIKKSKMFLASFYRELKNDFGLFYLEDPFGEDDFYDFAELRKKLGNTLIAGDDLTTTSTMRMERAREAKSVNAVIIKPNQIGTVSEALAAVRFARENGWAVVASHRSGETNDDFIADFAYGVAADGLKLGAPARGERIAKYNRLLEIERSLR
ncbi:MAG: enolase C-terminal domain-like protein [Patescibacteria group bacterium]